MLMYCLAKDKRDSTLVYTETKKIFGRMEIRYTESNIEKSGPMVMGCLIFLLEY